MTCVILGVAAVGAGVSAVGRYALPLRDSIAIGDCLELVQVSRSLDLNDTNSKVIQELAGDIKHIADSLEALALPDELLVLREEYEQQLTLRCAMFEYASNRKAPTQAEVEQDIARLQAGKDKIDQTLARAQKNPEILTGFQDEMSVVDFFQNWVAKLPNSQTG